MKIKLVNESARIDGADEVLVASGKTTRNRDYWTGKPFRIIPSGIRLEAWQKNPVLMYMHNFNLPIGTAEMFMRDGQLFANNFQFHRKKLPLATDNWIGDAIGDFDTAVIADLWEEKWLNAVSKHIIMSPADEEAFLETDDEMIIPTSEMIEFSIVTVPGDSEAVRQKMMAWGVNDHVINFCVDCNSGLSVPSTVPVTITTSNVTPGDDGDTRVEDSMPNEEEVEEVTAVAITGEEPEPVEEVVGEAGALESVEFTALEIVNGLVDDTEAMHVLRSGLGVDALMDRLQQIAEQLTHIAENVKRPKRARLTIRPHVPGTVSTIVNVSEPEPEEEPAPVPAKLGKFNGMVIK